MAGELAHLRIPFTYACLCPVTVVNWCYWFSKAVHCQFIDMGRRWRQ